MSKSLNTDNQNNYLVMLQIGSCQKNHLIINNNFNL